MDKLFKNEEGKVFRMNTALILAAGVGQRMRNAGLPKQFLKLLGKPIIIYTLEKFEQCDEINEIIVVCHGSYVEYMKNILDMYQIKKVNKVIVGGNDRQSSLLKGIEAIKSGHCDDEDIVIIHDGVRPMVSLSTISENIRVAKECGGAVTVRPVTESVVITGSDEAVLSDFKKRADTFSLTAPQSFNLKKLVKAYKDNKDEEIDGMPLLDAAMVYTNMGGKIKLVKEHNTNIKVTTPEDFYYLKAMLDLEESKYIFGL